MRVRGRARLTTANIRGQYSNNSMLVVNFTNKGDWHSRGYNVRIFQLRRNQLECFTTRVNRTQFPGNRKYKNLTLFLTGFNAVV